MHPRGCEFPTRVVRLVGPLCFPFGSLQTAIVVFTALLRQIEPFILALFSLFVRREHLIELSHRFLTPLTNAYQNYSVLDNTRVISLALFSSLLLLLFSFCQPSIISSKFYQIDSLCWSPLKLFER